MPWILRLLNRFRPREGWVILFLAWVAVCSLPAAAIEGKIITGLNPAIWLATSSEPVDSLTATILGCLASRAIVATSMLTTHRPGML